MPIRIVIADDHEIFRDGLKLILGSEPEFELAGEAENGKELISLAGKLEIDVIVTDIKMPQMDGIQATELLSKEFPNIKVIGLSMFDDENIVIRMLEAGAYGYLIKNAHKNEIIQAIKIVHNGGRYFDNHVSSKLAKMIASFRFNFSSGKHIVAFSEREKMVIEYICEGYSGKEIAQKLQLTVRTIETYRDNIMRKTDTKNVAGLVIYAIRNNLYKVE